MGAAAIRRHASPLEGLCDTDLQHLLNSEIYSISQDQLGVQGRLLHVNATTPVKLSPFAKIASTQVVTGAFAPEQLFIIRNDGRIIAGDGRCLTTDGRDVSVAPCSTTNLAQRWTGAFANATNEPSEEGKCISSRAFANRCVAWATGSPAVGLVPCNSSSATQKWTVGYSGNGAESYIHADRTSALTISGHDPIPREEVWAGPLYNHDVAVVFFNRATFDNVTRNVSVPIASLHGLPGASANTSGDCASVRDVGWKRDLGTACHILSALVEPRGAKLFRLTFV